jgi:3-hydroxyacyl-CoA dehydrogenase/enoyl-CoA hydratase/3-hydroxybutyryl-CoA epimerase
MTTPSTSSPSQISSTGPSAGALTLIVRPDGVAMITYDVVGEPVNTLKASFAAEFERVFDLVRDDPAILAAVLISGKPDSFIAGADIELIKGVATQGDAEALCRAGHAAIDRLARSPKPVVAAVHGAALGGGFEVALACHARILTDDPKTVLALPEVKLGLLPGMHGLQRLAALTNVQTALDYGLTGKNLRPAKARSLGVADDVVARPILAEVAARLALSLAKRGAPFTASRPKRSLKDELTTAALEKNPWGRALLFKKARAQLRKKTHGHYPSTERIVDVLAAYAQDGFEASKDTEARAFGELVVSDVARRLMEIFFATTALKKDTGTDDPSITPRSVEQIEVLGAGLMGAGIAYVSLDAGLGVRIKDKDDASLDRGMKHVSGLFRDGVKKRRLSRTDEVERLAKLTLATDYSGLKTADLVIEAVFEDLAIKHKVLAEVEASAREGVIFASNTSSIPITKIASAAKHPENVVGMHYFSPVHKMPLLEVIQTRLTSPEVVATAVDVGKRQGKTVIVVNDGVGFYTSRVLGPLMNEASYLVTEGVAIETVDHALVAWGWPVGPLTLLDEVGIDVAAHVGPIMLEAFGDRFEPPPTMTALVADDRKGRKNERGFYLYGAAAKKKGKGKHVDPSVYAVVGLPIADPKAKSPVAIEEIQLRCSLQFVNEALHCLGEGILRSPRDGDIGAIFGLGFPPFRGGPFRYVDAVGAGAVLERIEGYHARFGKRWAPAPMLVDLAKTGAKLYR